MHYVLSSSAMKDVNEITRYTVYNWGVDAVRAYLGEIEEKLDAIARGDVIKEKYRGGVSNLYVTRVRYHSIYYRVRSDKITEIARILHDKQDRVRHLDETISNLDLPKKGE